METFVVVVLLFGALGVAAAWWGSDTRDGRDWQPMQEPSGRKGSGETRGVRPPGRHRGVGALGRAAWRTLRSSWATQVELQQRVDLLNRPWEEDFLHWAGDGPHRRLHGSLAPPSHRRRRYSVTDGGWCPGHAADRQELMPNRAAAGCTRPVHGPCRGPGVVP